MTQEPVIPGFHVLSDPIRLQIIGLLQDEELSVSDLSQKLGTPQARFAFHLKSLVAAELITVRKQGRGMYYGLNKDQFDDL